MAENPSGPAEPLDVERLHYLVRLMKRYDLTALDVSDGSLQIRLRRSSPHAVPQPAALPLSHGADPSPHSQPRASAAAPARPEPPPAVSPRPRRRS